MKKHSQIIRAAALASAGVAALSLAACNKTGPAQNGAYVSGSTNTALPDASQPLPPSSTYQAVAQTPPPALPVYDQPPIPGPGYVWTPGYWGWSDPDDDYYWVPGTWIEPPEVGLLWTPGYWRFYDGRYLFSDGYWGPQVGFYGGVDYGYGYSGNGYFGGRWQGNQFYYNTQANNLGGRAIATVYNQGVPAGGGRVSYNGGPGGLRVAPAQDQVAAAQARHAPPTRSQLDQVRTARAEPQLRASVNRGSPPIAATTRPTAFHAAAGVTAARSPAAYAPPAPSVGESKAQNQGAPARQPAAIGRGRSQSAGGAAPAERQAVRAAPQMTAPMRPQVQATAPMRPQTRAAAPPAPRAPAQAPPARQTPDQPH